MWTSKSSFWKLLLIAVSATTVLSIERQSAEGQESPEEEKLRREEQQYIDKMYANVTRFRAAKKSSDAGNMCLRLFQTPFDRSVELLAIHDDPNVALQAAWRRYSRMVRRRDVYFGQQNATLDPRDVQRFLGFLEGRAQVLVPNWWEHALADPDENLPSKKRFRWLNSKEIVKEADDSNVTLEVYSKRFQLPVKASKSIMRMLSGNKLGIQMDEKHLLMLSYNPDGGSARLVCVDIVRSKVLWENDVWGLGDIGARTGPRLDHFMAMKIADKRIFVFGATIQGVYVEGFALKDGAPLIRFATTNWFVQDDE